MTENSEVAALSRRVEELTKAGSFAKSSLAIVGLISAVIGGLAGLGAGWVGFVDERRAWDSIKQIHELRGVGGQTIHSHEGLSAQEIAVIVGQIKLPNFSEFALKAEIPSKIDTSIFALKDELPVAPDLTYYATKDDVRTLMRQELPDYSNYALVSQIPNLDEYAKLTDLPTIPDLRGFATKAELSNYLRYGTRTVLIHEGTGAGIGPHNGYILPQVPGQVWVLRNP